MLYPAELRALITVSSFVGVFADVASARALVDARLGSSIRDPGHSA